MNDLLQLMHDTMKEVATIKAGSTLLKSQTLTEEEKTKLLDAIYNRAENLTTLLDAYYVKNKNINH